MILPVDKGGLVTETTIEQDVNTVGFKISNGLGETGKRKLSIERITVHGLRLMIPSARR